MFRCFFIFIGFLYFPPTERISVAGETHWLVTEDGRIQALADSLFNMARPHDFVQFFKQDDRVRKSEDAKLRLTNQKSVISQHEQQDDPQIENRLMTTDPDCVIAGKPLIQQDLFASTVIPISDVEIDWQKVVEIIKSAEISSEGSEKFPFCSNYFQLPFSMEAFEHLEGVAHRENLSAAPEPSVATVAFVEFPNISTFGRALDELLQHEPDSWLYYTLASYYWRALGNAHQSIECLRRALHFATKNFAVVPLLSLANVLHQTSNSKDAVVVIEAALTINDSISHLYFTMGHALAVTLQYNLSVEAFDKCLSLDSEYPLAKIHQAAVRCHRKLELALESQHQNLQKTLTELQSYQVRLKNFQKFHDDTMRHVVDPGARQDMTLAYDYFAYGPLDGLDCAWTVNEEGRYLDCRIIDYHAFKKTKLARVQKLRPKESGPHADLVDANTQETSSTTSSKTKQKVVILKSTDDDGRPFDFDKEKEYLNLMEKNRGLNLTAEPWNPKKYPLPESAAGDSDAAFRDDNWPDARECSPDIRLPTAANVPHLFLSPESKGFNLTTLFTTGLNLEKMRDEHPLPWYPPFCSLTANKMANLHLSCCDHLLGVQRAKNRDKEHLLAEHDLKQLLLDTAVVSSQSEAEVGQRILTLISFQIGPRWLVYNLAALYWRFVGVVSESVACLRLALNENGGAQAQKFADVGLFQLSYLAFSAGNRLDDAIALLHQAATFDSNEPLTHYMLAIYYILKENYNASASHLRICLDLDPKLLDAVELLKNVRCKIRAVRAQEAKAKIEKPPLSEKTDGEQLPKFFCLKETDGEHCYLEERMLPGATREEAESVAGGGGCPLVSLHCSKSSPFSSFVDVEGKGAGRVKFVDSGDALILSAFSKAFAPGPLVVEAELEPMEVAPELSLVDATLQPSSVNNRADQGEEEEEQAAPSKLEAPAVSGVAVEDDEDVDEEEDGGGGGEGGDEKSTEKKSGSVFDQLLETIKNEVEKKERNAKITPPPDDHSQHSNVLDLDNAEPDVWPLPGVDQVKTASSFVSLPTSAAECAIWKNRVKPDQPTSTWLSVTAKGINLRNYVDFNALAPKEILEPICPTEFPFSMWTMDHLHGYAYRSNLTAYKAERGLKDALQNLSGNKKESVEMLVSRVALALRQYSKSKYFVEDGKIVADDDAAWVLSTIAALYWRVKGNATMAIDCLRHSVTFAPLRMKDLALVSLANIFHQSGYYHSALITAGAALRNSPRFVVVHFTLANIYASMGDVEKAMTFLYSTLSLQTNFEPAKDRIRALFCTSGFIPPVVAEMLPNGGPSFSFSRATNNNVPS